MLKAVHSFDPLHSKTHRLCRPLVGEGRGEGFQSGRKKRENYVLIILACHRRPPTSTRPHSRCFVSNILFFFSSSKVRFESHASIFKNKNEIRGFVFLNVFFLSFLSVFLSLETKWIVISMRLLFGHTVWVHICQIRIFLVNKEITRTGYLMTTNRNFSILDVHIYLYLCWICVDKFLSSKLLSLFGWTGGRVQNYKWQK